MRHPEFRVSVIIPVYNAAKYLIQAVESVVHLEEVGEVILVEDASPDNALEICNALVKQYNSVKLYVHPNGENRGAGASRNLGIEKATSEFIAFLDADDFYLPNRFKKDKEVFLNDETIDGVYNAIGIFKDDVHNFSLFTINTAVPPHRLFHFLLRGTYGHFHTNAITFKKKLISRSGIFNIDLRLHQDSELWFRFAFHGKLICGEIDIPVAMVRQHLGNRIKDANGISKLQFWTVVKSYFLTKRIGLVNWLLINRKIAIIIRGPVFYQYLPSLVKELITKRQTQ